MRDIDDYSKEYNKNDFEVYMVKYRMKTVIQFIENNAKGCILEIGCGMDPLFRHTDRYEEYVLVEPSTDFFENAVSENGKYDGQEKRWLYNGFFEETREIADHKYDLIICSSLLHEIEDPGLLLSAIKSVCGSETLVHINVPNSGSFHRVLASHMGLIKDTHTFSDRNKTLQQHCVFDMNGLQELVRDNGFEIVDKGGYFIKPFTHTQMMKMIEAGIIDDPVIDGLYDMYPECPELCSEIYVNVRIKK